GRREGKSIRAVGFSSAIPPRGESHLNVALRPRCQQLGVMAELSAINRPDTGVRPWARSPNVVVMSAARLRGHSVTYQPGKAATPTPLPSGQVCPMREAHTKLAIRFGRMSPLFIEYY